MPIQVDNPDNDSPADDTPSTTPTTSPAEDPIIAQKASMFQSVYTQLWGEPATEAYLKAAAKAGLNVTEFAWRERHKPEYVQSDAFRNKASSLADMLHQLGVV